MPKDVSKKNIEKLKVYLSEQKKINDVKPNHNKVTKNSRSTQTN